MSIQIFIIFTYIDYDNAKNYNLLYNCLFVSNDSSLKFFFSLLLIEINGFSLPRGRAQIEILFISNDILNE
jgi:hypothetical protein